MSGSSHEPTPRRGRDTQCRYGKQPFAGLLRKQGRSVRRVGVDLGFPLYYADGVAFGRAAPTDDFKQAISDFLGRPVEDLFTPDALAAKYRVTSRAKGFRKGASDE